MHKFVCIPTIFLVFFAASFSHAQDGCAGGGLCEDFSRYSIGVFQPITSIQGQTTNELILWQESNEANQIRSQVGDDKYLRVVESKNDRGFSLEARAHDRFPFILDIPNQNSTHTIQAKIRIESDQDVFDAPAHQYEALITTDGSIRRGISHFQVHIEGVGPNQYRVYETYRDRGADIRSESLPLTVEENTDFIEISTVTDFENLYQAVFADGQLVSQRPISNSGFGGELFSMEEPFGILPRVEFQIQASAPDAQISALHIDDVEFRNDNPHATEPTIEPSFTVSQGPARVGDDVQFTVTADPSSDWELFLGETDSETQTERSVSSDDYDSGDVITIKYFTQGEFTPRLVEENQEITLPAPVVVECYPSRSLREFAGESSTDCDGDGLQNQWEISGFGSETYVDGNGQTATVNILPLSAFGANPFKRDIILEVDLIGNDTGAELNELTQFLGDVVDAFENNPGFGAINLIFTESETITQSDFDSVTGTDTNVYFDSLRFGDGTNECDGYWGTSAERDEIRSMSLCSEFEAAYRKAVKHAFVVNHPSAVTSGGKRASGIASPLNGAFISNVPVNKPENSILGSIVGLRTPEETRVVFQQTFMHELGHTLGLLHGGSDGFHCKPNYQSVMNYRYQGKNSLNNAPVDFSHTKLATMFTKAMDETTGLEVAFSEFGFVDDRYQVLTSIVSGPFENTLNRTPNSTADEFDWSGNFIILGSDSEYNPPSDLKCDFEDTSESIPGAEMVGYNDWNNLIFIAADAAALITSSTDIEGQTVENMDGALSASLMSDLDNDGVIGGLDNCPVVPNAAQIDDDGDNIGSRCDNCPFINNVSQFDVDGDGIGDACDAITGAPGLLLPHDEWALIGIPLQSESKGMAQLFAPVLDPNEYGIEWIVFRFNKLGYERVELGDVLDSASGYWIKQITGVDVTVSLPPRLDQSEAMVSSNCFDEQPCHYTEFPQADNDVNWTLVSNPYPFAIAVSRLFLSVKGNSVDSQVLVSSDSSDFNHSGGMFVYDYLIGDYRFLTADDQLEPWQAGWVGIQANTSQAVNLFTGFVE